MLADSDLFGDDCIDELDHRALWLNLVLLGRPRPTAGAGPCATSATDTDPSTSRRGRGCATRPTRSRCSRRPTDRCSATPIRTRPAATSSSDGEAIEELAPRFPHDADYLTAAVEDLRAWDFGKPDFTRALEEFRPELMRTDGIEHLVAVPDVQAERLARHVLRGADRARPVAGLDRRARAHAASTTRSTCRSSSSTRRAATTASARCCSPRRCRGRRPRPVGRNFGAIFCDREAARLRRLAGAAADLLRLNLPPDAACMLASPGMSQQAYILWDLIHDRAHSHGDLPFDPFMIRQRAPYWMYSLEELRCDLTAFGQAVTLEAEGVAFARYVQYAILLDRLLRFPITGVADPQLRRARRAAAVRVPAPPRLPALDRQPADDRVGPGRRGRRRACGTRSRSCTGSGSTGPSSSTGPRRTTWSRRASRRRPDRSGRRRVREFADVEDPRPYVDLVRDDEFPLSIFYSSLKAKLAA